MSGDAVKVHTLSAGEPGGKTVVFAHGLEDPWTSWVPLARTLDPRWRMLALDLPWRPGNDYQWGDRIASDWLADGLGLVGAHPDAVVAHSFGANATLTLLCGPDPRPCTAVVLICPLYRQPQHQVTWTMFDRARETFVQHLRDGMRARMGERADAIERDVLDSMMDLALERVGPAGFLTVFQQFITSAHLPLSNIEVPTYLLVGDADPTLSRGSALALAREIPGGRIRVNEDYDHFCHVRKVRGVAAQISEFVAAATSTAGASA